ncbi:hypothetical protein BJ742DRAFT_497500 [Cladochytrium replicatum]|nr:hypothetical protein BJ742DRAFT_497500 [Cladochytrium replicatum]
MYMGSSKDELVAMADVPARLVPIRLDLDVDGVRIHDAFTWNLNETQLTPEKFAQMLADDFEVPVSNQFVPTIAQAIRDQCASYAAAAEEDVFAPTGELQNASGGLGRVSRSPGSSGHSSFVAEEHGSDVGIVVSLNIQVGVVHLRDRFIWPLYNFQSSPEAFARSMAADLGLGGEFVPAIAHSIREQVCNARLHFDDAPIAHEEGRYWPFRQDVGDHEWEPELRELSEAELDRITKERDRNARRLRRSQRVTRSSQNGYSLSDGLNPYQRSISPPSQPQKSIPYKNYIPTHEEQMLMSQLHILSPSNQPDPSQEPWSIVKSDSVTTPPYKRHPSFDELTFPPPPPPAYPFHYTDFQHHQQPYPPFLGVDPTTIAPQTASPLDFQPTALAHGPSPTPKSGGPNRSKKRSAGPKEPPTINTEMVRRQVERMQMSPVKCSSAGSDVPRLTPGSASSSDVGYKLPKQHRGFGASAMPFNADGSVEVGVPKKLALRLVSSFRCIYTHTPQGTTWIQNTVQCLWDLVFQAWEFARRALP